MLLLQEKSFYHYQNNMEIFCLDWKKWWKAIEINIEKLTLGNTDTWVWKNGWMKKDLCNKMPVNNSLWNLSRWIFHQKNTFKIKTSYYFYGAFSLRKEQLGEFWHLMMTSSVWNYEARSNRLQFNACLYICRLELKYTIHFSLIFNNIRNC